MAETQRISIAVLTRKQDDVEIVNKNLRAAGYPVHCFWVKQSKLFARLLAERRLELILLNCDTYPDTIRQACKQRDGFQPDVPLLAIKARTDEVIMAAAMNQGACDLVSLENRHRLQAVVSRELRAFRIERALNATLQSAASYRKQLHDYMEGSNSAIAYVQEGIITRVNGAWLQMFQVGKKDEIVGMPLMDAFETESQAAVKGAIIAATRKKWQPDEKLEVNSRLGGNNVRAVSVEFQLSESEDGPHVQVCIAPPEKKSEEPTKLVHDALQRDPTTLFFHRAQFLERLTKRLARKPASGLHLLAYIKPDSFSEVVDEAGFIASEDVLGLFAEEVRKRLHPRDLAGRFEGTSLLVLLERGSERDAEGWGKQLTQHIARQRFGIGNREIALTCTVGICPVSDVFVNLDELITATRAAHGKGKSAGGNQAAVNTAVDEDTKLKRHDQIWVKRIKAALIERRFRLAHLPIAGLRRDNGAMYDMLIRMLDEQGNALLPSVFLPAAERNNLMKTLDRWMITASIEHCRTEHADRVFVRLSRHSLQDASLVRWIGDELKRNKIEPGRLCVQAAEQDAARYIKPTRSMAGELQKQGIGFALEHFGIDGSRLQILEILKPNYVKVDGELMHALMTDTELQARVSAMVAKATELGIETIAERVENANTMAVLFQLGFHYMQGHYVHEPEVVLQEPISIATTSLEAIAGH